MVARSIATQLFGTVVAVLGGWLAPFLLFGGVRLLGVSEDKQPLDVGILVGSTIATSIFMAWFIIPIWVLVLIPLYLFVPQSSPLWRWPICTACGATAGFVIMASVFMAFDSNSSWSYGAWQFCGIAALVGGATCLVGSLTRHVFKPNHLTNR